MELKTFASDYLWVAQMPLKIYGLEIGTRMTVCRLSSGDLWVHSPIPPEPELRQQLDSLGEVVFFHRHSRTLIVTDLCIFGHPEQPPLTRFVLWVAGVYQKPGPLLDVKLAYLDKKAACASLEKVLEWDFEKMILAHGHLLNSDAKKVFERVYQFLLEQ